MLHLIVESAYINWLKSKKCLPLCHNQEVRTIMNTIDLEVQKAGLAKAILNETDETLIKKLWAFMDEKINTVTFSETSLKERNFGVLEEKISFYEAGNGKITTDEFLGI
jgi:hypothetical protein